MNNCDLRRANFEDAILDGSNITNNNFKGSSLAGIDFTNVVFDEGIFKAKDLTASIFKFSQLNGSYSDKLWRNNSLIVVHDAYKVS